MLLLTTNRTSNKIAAQQQQQNLTKMLKSIKVKQPHFYIICKNNNEHDDNNNSRKAVLATTKFYIKCYKQNCNGPALATTTRTISAQKIPKNALRFLKDVTTKQRRTFQTDYFSLQRLTMEVPRKRKYTNLSIISRIVRR